MNNEGRCPQEIIHWWIIHSKKNISTTNNAMWIWMAKYGDFSQKRGERTSRVMGVYPGVVGALDGKMTIRPFYKGYGSEWSAVFTIYGKLSTFQRTHFKYWSQLWELPLNHWYSLEVENDTQHSPLQEASCFLYTNWEKVPIFSVVYMYTYMIIYVYMQSYFT